MGTLSDRDCPGANHALAAYQSRYRGMVRLALADPVIFLSSQGWRPFHRAQGDQGAWRCVLDRLPASQRPAREALSRPVGTGDDYSPRGGSPRPGDAVAGSRAISPAHKDKNHPSFCRKLSDSGRTTCVRSNCQPTSLNPRHLGYTLLRVECDILPGTQHLTPRSARHEHRLR